LRDYFGPLGPGAAIRPAAAEWRIDAMPYCREENGRRFLQVFKFGSGYRFGLPILNFLTDRLGGPEIDDQLEAGRLLDRQISRFCAAE
jgi:hypothetical protein